jgi:hypothetical protein
MSVPDMHLTILAYDQLIAFLESSMTPDMNTSKEITSKYRHQIARLQQLKDALEIELLSH